MFQRVVGILRVFISTISFWAWNWNGPYAYIHSFFMIRQVNSMFSKELNNSDGFALTPWVFFAVAMTL